MRRRGLPLGLVMATVLLAAAAFLLGRAAHAITASPIQLRDGVPVGVGHSPGGAVAAADDYLVTEQASVERDPARFAAMVSEDYAPALKADSMSSAAADRQRDPGGMLIWARGGEVFTVIGAHRLYWYRAGTAQVTTWAAQVFWGPGQPPCQAWSIGEITLGWRDGHWEATGMSTLPVAAPAPAALPQATPSDDTAAAFSSELAGFTPVTYGSPG